MNRRKPQQIGKLLHKADEELAKGKAVDEFCREEQISAATYYRWQRKYGGLQVEDAKRLRALDVENAKLKRLLAEALLANDALQEFLAKKHDGGGAAHHDGTHAKQRFIQASCLLLGWDLSIREQLCVASSCSRGAVAGNDAQSRTG